MLIYMCNHIGYTMQVDRQESAREQKRAEVLDSMKRLFPGVVSKFIVLILIYCCSDLCIHHLKSYVVYCFNKIALAHLFTCKPLYGFRQAPLYLTVYHFKHVLF